jgi:hypothetical protein
MKRIHFRKSDSNSDAVVTQRQRSLRQRNEPRQMRKAVAVQNPPLRVTEAWSGTKGNNKSLLLVALDAPLQNKPDRAAALNAMRRNGFAVHKKLDHHEWLDAIAHHKFTLAPFGHGVSASRLYFVSIVSSHFYQCRTRYTSTHRNSVVRWCTCHTSFHDFQLL